MKICKNGIDIILYLVTSCSRCELKTCLSVCIWSKVVRTRRLMDCGAIMTNILSDIFKI